MKPRTGIRFSVCPGSENQDITAFDTKRLSDNIGTEVSGFLGFTTLRLLDIKIDYRDALVDFQYDAKRW